MRDYYEVLEVSPDAEVEVITAAYKALMRKYHPDTNKSAAAAAKAQEINAAYEVLKSTFRRREYDAKRGQGGSAPPPPPPPAPDRQSDAPDPGGHQQKRLKWPITFLLGIFAVTVAIVFLVSGIPSTSDEAHGSRVANQEFASPVQVTGQAVDTAYQAGDPGAASRDYQALAEEGNAVAQNQLGFNYQHGIGVPQSDTEAVRWYRLAALQGFEASQLLLGEMYAMGRGVPQDYGEAVRLYRLSAEQGNALAQANLGAMYANGNGVPRSDVKAYMWLNLAAAQLQLEYFPDILTNRDSVSERLSPQDISRAQQLSAECLARNYRGC